MAEMLPGCNSEEKKKLFSVSLKQFQVTAVIAKTFHLVSVCSAI